MGPHGELLSTANTGSGGARKEAKAFLETFETALYLGCTDHGGRYQSQIDRKAWGPTLRAAGHDWSAPLDPAK